MDILIVEDSKDIATSVGEFLVARGHSVDFAFDGVTGLHLAATGAFDAIVLDIGLPRIDGLTLAHRLRSDARRATPILMLTARDTLPDKVAGFEHGADDYLVKPFAMEELEVRLRALHRRATEGHAAGRLRVGDLELDEATYEVTRDRRVLRLAPIPFRILAFLMREQHRVVRRDELERAVWGDDPPASDALRTHIAQVRHEVDGQGGAPLGATRHRLGLRGLGH